MTEVLVQDGQQREGQGPHHSITLALPHDVRTPLTGILTATELLETQCDGLERREIQQIAQIIHRSANRLHHLLQNLLLCAQLEVASGAADAALPGQSGLTQWMAHMSLDGAPGQGDLYAPATVIADAALRQARRTGREADLTLELDDGVIQMVEAHLTKIVQELLDNAFRYSEVGTPVRVTGRRRDGRFALSITDDGRGMTAEQMAQVGAFLPSDCYEQQGLGLGLVIVKRLTELYGGKLTLESTLGKGTAMHLLLPA